MQLEARRQYPVTWQTADQTLQIRPQVLLPLAQPIERSEQLAWAVGMQPKQPTAMHSSMYAEDRNDAVREAAMWAQPALEDGHRKQLEVGEAVPRQLANSRQTVHDCTAACRPCSMPPTAAHDCSP